MQAGPGVARIDRESFINSVGSIQFKSFDSIPTWASRAWLQLQLAWHAPRDSRDTEQAWERRGAGIVMICKSTYVVTQFNSWQELQVKMYVLPLQLISITACK